MSAENHPMTGSRSWRYALYAHLRLLFTALTLLVVALFVLIAVRQWHATVNDAETRLGYINRVLVQGTRTTLTAHDLVLRGIGEQLRLLHADTTPERGRDFIERMQATDKGMAGFGLARPDGQLTLVSGIPAGKTLPNLLESPASRDSFLRTLATGHMQTGRAYHMAALNQWVIPIRVPIAERNGAPGMVMTAGYRIEGGTTTWANMALPDEVRVSLLRDDGYYQYYYPLPAGPVDPVLQEIYGRPVHDDLLRQFAAWAQPQGFTKVELAAAGGTQYAAYERIDEYGLTASTMIPRSAVIHEWLKRLMEPLFLLGAYLLASYALFRNASIRQARAEADVSTLSSWQQAVLDGANYSIIATDTAGTIVSFNRAAERLLGYRAAEVVGKTTPVTVHDRSEVAQRAAELTAELNEPVEPGFEVFVAKARRGEADEREWTYIRKDGSRVPVLLSVSAVRAADNSVTGFMGIAADISDRKQSQANLRDSIARYQTLFEGAGDAIFLMNADRFIDCNPATLKMFDCTRDQIIGSTPDRFSPERQPDGRLSTDKALEKIIGAFEGQTQFFEWRHTRFDRTPFDAEVTLNAIEIGGMPHLLATVRDISDRKHAEAEIAASRVALLQTNENLRLLNAFSARLQGCQGIEEIAQETSTLLLSVATPPKIAIYVLDPGATRLRLVKSHGFTDDMNAAGQNLPLKGSLSGLALAENRLITIDDLASDRRPEPRVGELLVAAGITSGVVIPMFDRGSALGTINLLYNGPHPFGLAELDTLASIGNTTALAIANARHIHDLEQQATHDALTGLANRSVLHREFRRHVRDRQPAALLLLDLDRFKEINDTLGHQVGDKLLSQIGPRLHSAIGTREPVISRLGGDEFAVLLPTVGDADDAVQTGHDLVAALRRPFTVDAATLQIDASIGIALHPAHGTDSHELLRSADVAMYRAKHSGAGVSLYQPALDTNTPERLALMADFRRALERDELLLHFQPKLDLAGNRIVGFEALVRWQHPRLGLLYPEHFLPMVELSDAIDGLTRKVIVLALEQQRRWRAAGSDYAVAINLSARNLLDERCATFIQQTVEHYRTEPGRVELEITETSLMRDPEGAATLLHRMATLGVHISVDDFGTGYSSLAYLRRLPIDMLKIDRTFVMDMIRNEQDASIVRSTIGLAHSLNLKVVAEGVEDAATMTMLRQMGCDLAQGYYIGRPIPAAEVGNIVLPA